MTALAEGRAATRWFDPFSGAYTEPEMYRTAGSWSFTPPWDHDAVLVFEVEPAP
jgi:hypothetical protein